MICIEGVVISSSSYIREKQSLNQSFWKWFGKSKIVDEKRKPLVVYHGTHSSFNSFDGVTVGSNSGNFGFYGKGFYFSKDASAASFYATKTRPNINDAWKNIDGGNVMPVFLSIKKPFILSSEGESLETVNVLNSITELNIKTREGKDASNDLNIIFEMSPPLAELFRKRLISLGYDGIVYNKGQEIVAFYPEQIKSIYNKGTWDITSKNITEQRNK